MDDDQPPSEFTRIRRLTSSLPPGEGIRVGIGDDAAVLAPPAGELVVAADLMAEGIHFDLAWTPWEALGHKALAVNLSDLAAMGARPAWALVTLALPRDVGDDALDALYRGLGALAAEHQVAIIGGDTTAARPGALTLSVTAIGAAGDVAPVTRRGARPGDLIAVCGSLGGAARALERLSAGEAPGPWAEALLLPRPLVVEGRWLASRGIPTAMIDVSDGLLGDLRHLLARGRLGEAPQLGARLRSSALPLHPTLEGLPRDKALALALSGGEDYALLFTLPPERRADLADADAPPTAVIGQITSSPGITWDPPGPPPDAGIPWRHFPGAG